jgi:hypothetical protein
VSRRKIYAVVSGEYSDYAVHALYEHRADAEAVSEKLGSHYDIQDFPFYPPGDHSFRPIRAFRAFAHVAPDGTLQRSPEAQYDHGYEDDEGLIAGEVIWALGGGRGWGVAGYGRTKEQAIKGCRDRAVQVSALVVEGIDPLAAERRRD